MTSNTGTEHWRPPGHFAVHCAYSTCFESFIMSDNNFHSVKETFFDPKRYEKIRELAHLFEVLHEYLGGRAMFGGGNRNHIFPQTVAEEMCILTQNPKQLSLLAASEQVLVPYLFIHLSALFSDDSPSVFSNLMLRPIYMVGFVLTIVACNF